MEKYVDFICSIIPSKQYTNIILSKEYRNKHNISINKLTKAPTLTKINVVEKYTRSAKIEIEFNTLKVNDDHLTYKDTFIFYMSRKKGPERLLYELNRKIIDRVSYIFDLDDRAEEIAEMYRKVYIHFSNI